MKNRYLIAVMVTMAVATGATQPAPGSADVALEEARKVEVFDGDLPAAIEQYRRIADRYATADRTAAATALLKLAEVMERLENPQAADVYRQIVQTFGDQTVTAAIARVRLTAANGAGQPRVQDGPSTRPVWTGAGVDLRGRVSRDGRYLTFGDENSNLAVRDLLTGEERSLTSDAAGRQYVEHSIWAHDNNRIAYAWGVESDRYELRIIARTGDTPRVVYRTPEPAWLMPFDWSLDGRLIAIWLGFGQTSQLGLLSVADGSLRVLKSFDWRPPANMSFSPDGRYIAYDYSPADDGRSRDIYVIAVDGSKEVPAVVHAANDQVLAWFPDGTRLLFTSDRRGTNGVYVLPMLDGGPNGEPRALIADVGEIWAPMGFTAGGEFLYGVRQVATDVQIVDVGGATGSSPASAEPLGGQFTGNRAAGEWSPDGTQLAFVARTPNQHLFREVSFYTPATRQLRTVPHDLGWFYPSLDWDADGRSVLLKAVDMKGREGFYRVDVRSGATARLDTAGVFVGQPTVFSRDGRQLLSLTEGRLTRVQLATGLAEPVITSRVRTFALSPAGDQFAVVLIPEPAPGATAPLMTLATLPVGGGEPTPLFSGASFPAVAWSRNGQDVYFAERGGHVSRMGVKDRTRQDLGIRIQGITKLSVHPDGTKLAITTSAAQPEVHALRNLDPK